VQELAAETPEAELVEAHAQFAEHLWDQTMDVLQRAADGLASTKELVVFFRKRASAEQDLAMSMRKMCLVCTAHPSLLASRLRQRWRSGVARRPRENCTSRISSAASCPERRSASLAPAG